MRSVSFFGELMQVIAERGRQLLPSVPREQGRKKNRSIRDMCEALLASRGEASGMAIAGDILARWALFDEEERLAFMTMLLETFGPDEARLETAIDAYRAERTPKALHELHEAAEPRRQELIRCLNLAPEGIATLVGMRETLLKMKRERPELDAVDADFVHLLGSWFNRGFLVLRPINWSTPADILEKVIRYEAVHEIGTWDELRRRLAPEDRRCFAFFHPQLVDDPLIFVEVALARDTPAAISEVLDEARSPIAAAEATTAVFYSISNCQAGLRGISFGNFLIKQVVEELRRELPALREFVTLSPVPGFSEWLAGERKAEVSDALGVEESNQLSALDDPEWFQQPQTVEALRPAMLSAAAWYFLRGRNIHGGIIDPVARFHLGNGARLERINFLADRSPRAMRQAHGLMVNYLYKLDDIEANHEAFAARGEVAAAPSLKRLVRDREPRSPLAIAQHGTDANQSRRDAATPQNEGAL